MNDIHQETALYRILDANFNRALEGIRVCEDLCRFAFSDQAQMEVMRNIRHILADELKSLNRKQLLSARQSAEDPGNQIFENEMNRSQLEDLMHANFQRVKESLRVLEECLKLVQPHSAETMKRLRFQWYECEKKIHT